MKFPVLNRRFNPVVDRFVTSDLSLQEIIAAVVSPPLSPILTALALLSDCLDGRRLARDAIQAAKNVPLKGQDPELTILLLVRWAELACRLSSPSEAESLLHQARSLLSERTHPDIHATIHFAMSVLAEVRGNQQEREKLLRQAAGDLQEHAPRRKFYLWELGLLLARQGRGMEFKEEMQQLTWQTNARFPLEHLDRIHFIDAVETGRLRAAAERMPAIAPTLNSPAPGRLPYREYQMLLALMHEAVEKAAVPLPKQTPTPPAPPTGPVWVQTVNYLLIGDAPGALKLARLEAKRLLASIFGTGFGALNLIRAELASGNAEAARRLLAMREARGNTHYLDPFFTARVELLCGRHREAGEHFREALDNAKHYDATGRLDFEMALAIELSEADAIQLRKDGDRPRTVTPSAISTQRAGGSEKDAPPPHRRRPLILGRSQAILKLRETILQMADQDVPVLITGETGTGKELVAVALHASGHRADKPFVPVNCGAISETLLESELFGHERGAFTGADRTTRGLFEDAGEGTLLLDEIGDVSPRLQSVLLRVLESGEIRAIGSSHSRQIHCRILAATNADLEKRVAEGTFRQDLLYRLQRLTIHVPPLRQRRDDIMPLVRHFLDEGRPVGTHASASPAFIDAACHYDWPGNVRELRNVIERMRLVHSDKLAYTDADLDIKRPLRDADRADETRPSPEPLGPAPGTDGSAASSVQAPSGFLPPPTDISAFLQNGTSLLRRNERLKSLFDTHHRLTRGEIVKILDISPNTATKYLKHLCEEGFIRRIEPSASSRSHYFERHLKND